MARLLQLLPLLPVLALGAAPMARAQDGLCLTGDFDAFLLRFGREIAVQEAATADPLAVSFIDAAAEPEPQQVSREIPLAELTWPVMPDPGTLSLQAMTIEIATPEGGGREVLIRGTDSGLRTTYVFAEMPCWTLVRIVDDSM